MLYEIQQRALSEIQTAIYIGTSLDYLRRGRSGNPLPSDEATPRHIYINRSMYQLHESFYCQVCKARQRSWLT